MRHAILMPLLPMLLAILLAIPLAPRAGTDAGRDAGPDKIAPDAAGGLVVEVHFFWSLTCPHCTAARPFVESLPLERPWVRLHSLELSRHPDHVRRYRELAAELNQPLLSVPAVVFCGEIHQGWDDAGRIGALIQRRLDDCRARIAHPDGAALAGMTAVSGSGTGPDLAAGTQPDGQPRTGTGAKSPAPDSAPNPTLDPAPIQFAHGAFDPRQRAPTPDPAPIQPIELPLLGALDPQTLSLPVLTLVLAGLDAFNPCAFFVLLFLLSMLVHQRSRARMLIVGGLFVFVSGLLYFAFMAAWLNLFQMIGHLAWVTLAAGGLAVLMGLFNVKDFFLFRRGPSLSIPDAKKPDLFRRARAILQAERLPAMLAATAFLAVAANSYELLCTAGFPMVYTRLLTLADLTPAARYAWLALYNLIYVVPLGLIVIAFASRLGGRKLDERTGRLLKLLSGAMMLGLGGLLLFAPALLGRAEVGLGLMALAGGLVWLAARLTRA